MATMLLMATHAKASMPEWTGVRIEQFAQSKVDRNRIWAIGGRTLFKSEDEGKSWKPIHVPYSLGISWVGIDHLDGKKVYVLGKRAATSNQDTFFVSTDEGDTWAMQATTGYELSNRESNTTGLSKVYAPETSVAANQLSVLTLSGDANWPRYGAVQTVGNTMFLLDGSTIWAREAGKEWRIRHTFQGKWGHHPNNFLVLDDGKLVVRLPDGNWLQSSDNGNTWKAATNGFQALNRRAPQNPKPNELFGHGVNECHVHMNSDNKKVLVATCLWTRTMVPGGTCLHYSRDGGRTWAPPRVLTTRREINCSIAGLPGAWQSEAMLIDDRDPNKMLISWAFGGVFRTPDGGKSWVASDQHLTFAEHDDRHGGTMMFSSPLVVSAVMRRDLAYLDRLLAQGQSVNAIGNQSNGVLGAELSALAAGPQAKPVISMWAALRARGANVNLPEERRAEFMEIALRLNMPEIIDDLIAAGYDWGRPNTTSPDSRYSKTEIERLIRGTDPSSKQLLDHVVEAYVKAGKFPSADLTVRELLESQKASHAVAILSAATRDIPFDKQTTPERASKVELAGLLLKAKEFDWARRVFLLVPAKERGSLRHTYSDLIGALGETCNLNEVAWYVSRGVMEPNLLGCLKATDTPPNNDVLKHLVDSQSIDAEVWQDLLGEPGFQWVKRTKYHQQFEGTLKDLPHAIVGLILDPAPTDRTQVEERHYLEVTYVVEGYPAQFAGMRRGDKITHVDGRDVGNLQFNAVRKLLVGRAGTQVVVDALRAGEKMQFRLERRPPTPGN